jgi:hypothetical protein
MLGNVVAPALRRRLHEERMLVASLVVATVTGIAMALLGGVLGAVMLAAALNLVASISRLSFESIVQRDAPGANHGRAFAVFETRFQLAWALAAFLAVAVQVPGPIGFLIVGLAAGGTLIHLLVGFGRLANRGRRGRATGREPRSRSASARRRPR